MPEALLTVAQLARALEVPAEQILTWSRHGRGPNPVDDAPIPRWRPQAVCAWLTERIAHEVADGVAGWSHQLEGRSASVPAAHRDPALGAAQDADRRERHPTPALRR